MEQTENTFSSEAATEASASPLPALSQAEDAAYWRMRVDGFTGEK